MDHYPGTATGKKAERKTKMRANQIQSSAIATAFPKVTPGRCKVPQVQAVPSNPISSSDPRQCDREKRPHWRWLLLFIDYTLFGECAMHWATVGCNSPVTRQRLATLGHNGADASGCNMRLSCDRRQEHNIHYIAIDHKSGQLWRCGSG